jgi:hypothetical protein
MSAMSEYYSTKDVSELTRASKQIIRTYTSTYARYFSTEATPEIGKPRRFTETDVKLIAYIYHHTQEENLNHEQVLAQLASGALEIFAWEIPEQQNKAYTALPERSESWEYDTGALIPLERLQAAQALLLDVQRREDNAREEVKRLQERINQLERELGTAQGELNILKSQRRKPPKWWTTLFGE